MWFNRYVDNFIGKVKNMKKVIALLLVMVIVASTSVFAFAAGTGVGNGNGNDTIPWDEIIGNKTLKGDLNGDGKVSSIDARKALQKVVGTDSVSTNDLKVADFNGDNKLTAYDARQILKLAAG